MKPKQILELRKRLKESQAKFADRVGVRAATIADWESGKVKPSPMAEKLLQMIAEK